MGHSAVEGGWGGGGSHFHCNEPWQMANSRASQSRSQGTIKTSGHCVSLTHRWEIKSPGKHKTGLTSALFAVILPPPPLLPLTPTPSYPPPPISSNSVSLGVQEVYNHVYLAQTPERWSLSPLHRLWFLSKPTFLNEFHCLTTTPKISLGRMLFCRYSFIFWFHKTTPH